MRVLIQRVSTAQVEVEGETVASIGSGLLLLVGISKTDLLDQVRQGAEKVINLRVFEDQAGKMNRSVTDTGGQILVVSQFTLYADCKKGNRPGFDRAAPADEAFRMYMFFTDILRSNGLDVRTGVFGEKMQVTLTNDGPVTIWLDTEEGR